MLRWKTLKAGVQCELISFGRRYVFLRPWWCIYKKSLNQPCFPLALGRLKPSVRRGAKATPVSAGWLPASRHPGFLTRTNHLAVVRLTLTDVSTVSHVLRTSAAASWQAPNPRTFHCLSMIQAMHKCTRRATRVYQIVQAGIMSRS